jgi:hypothetical protein
MAIQENPGLKSPDRKLDWHEELLLTRRNVTLELEPFPYFYIDDYLPSDIFQAARQSFPIGEKTDRYNNKKQVFSLHRNPEAVARFIAETDVWFDLTRFFDSERFISDLNRFLRPALRKARGLEGLRRWRRRDRQTLVPVADVPVTFGYEFSILEDGAYLEPHTDAPAKLVSLLLYFADDDWRPEFGGTTDVCRAKNPAQDRNWMNRSLGFGETETVFSSAFKPNRLFGFIKSENSLHSVSPLACGPDRKRLSFNFNVLIDPVEANGRLTRMRNELIRRREAPAFEGLNKIASPMRSRT